MLAIWECVSGLFLISVVLTLGGSWVISAKRLGDPGSVLLVGARDPTEALRQDGAR